MAVSILSAPSQPFLSRNKQEVVVQSTGYEALDRYRVTLRIQFSTDVYRITQKPDDEGKTYFRPNTVFDPLLKFRLPVGNALQASDHGWYTFAIQVIESWYVGEVLTENSVATNYAAFKAGMGHRLQQFGFLGTFITPAVRQFLTYIRTESVTANCLKWLTFFAPNGLIRQYVELFYEDGTSEVFPVGGPASIVEITEGMEDRILFVPAGYDQLELGALATKPVSVYAIWMQNGETIVSEKYHFELIRRKLRMVFLYANSAGGLATLPCYGHFDQQENFANEVAEADVPLNNLPSDAQFIQSRSRGRTSFKANTGWFVGGSEEGRAVAEFFLSEFRYVIEGDQYLPIELISKEILSNQSRPGMMAVSFDFQYAFEYTAYNFGV